MSYFPPTGVELPDLQAAIPKVFFTGSVDAGSPFTASSAPGSRMAWVLQGIDAYATIQPNNGTFQVIASSASWPHAGAQIFVVQQSQNFPGPFHWRGSLPFLSANFQFQAVSTVPFVFTAWGLETYDFRADWNAIQT